MWTNGIYFIDAFRWRGLRHMAQFFRHEMADGGNHASVGCTARHKCVSMAESCHPYGFGGGYGGYGAFFGLQRPPLRTYEGTTLDFFVIFIPPPVRPSSDLEGQLGRNSCRNPRRKSGLRCQHIRLFYYSSTSWKIYQKKNASSVEYSKRKLKMQSLYQSYIV